MSLYEIYFSPTGGTKKVADIMIKAMKKDAQEIDMIKDPDKILQTEFSEDDICLIAVPSYGGRIPSVTVDKFQKLQAKGTKAILVAVFGNRAIDDTLVEMQDILENAGFVCVVGVEAVAEHSLMHQFGTGRPDQQDEKELIRFSEQIMKKIETKMECMKVELPGNHNYREYNGVPLKQHTRIFLHLLHFSLLWLKPRPISNSQLHTLPYFHLCPIYLVVFKGSYYLMVWEILSLGGLHA